MRALANAGLGGGCGDTGRACDWRRGFIFAGIYNIGADDHHTKIVLLVRSIKSKCLNRMILFGQASLQRAIAHFMAHYHTERNHQGLANQLLRAAHIIAPSQPVHPRQRLGGMLNYYHRAAA
jgi:hypothetical protein